MNHENVLGKQDYNLQTSKTIHYFLLWSNHLKNITEQQ
jgi:hypothetical protein